MNKGTEQQHAKTGRKTLFMFAQIIKDFMNDKDIQLNIVQCLSNDKR